MIWDVFHNDRLEIERQLTTDQVRAALAEGSLHPDDLGRPAGSSEPWTRLRHLSLDIDPEFETPARARCRGRSRAHPHRRASARAIER